MNAHALPGRGHPALRTRCGALLLALLSSAAFSHDIGHDNRMPPPRWDPARQVAPEDGWAAQAGGLSAPLPPGTWRTWRVRPENVPVRRLAGISQVIGAWGTGDPLDRLLNDLEAAEHAANPSVLARRWEARAEEDDFWSRHHDFGRPLPTPQPWLVGAGRAGEVVVNVLLPFAFALGQASSGSGAGGQALSERALALYRRYPSGPPNRLRRLSLPLRPMAERHAGAENSLGSAPASISSCTTGVC